MLKLSDSSAIKVVQEIIASDMIYIHKKENGYYTAEVYTRVVPKDIDEDTLQDYVMDELDFILTYFSQQWDEGLYGPYDYYAEVIRDFVIEKIHVNFHNRVDI